MMMRANARAALPRGATAHCDLGAHLKCDRQAEEMLRTFWDGIADGAVLPPEIRGLADGAQLGPPGIRRALIMEKPGERLRVEVTAVGRGRTQLHLWREVVPSPLQLAPEAGAEPAIASSSSDGLTQREREVALLVADGLRSREVAERLGIAPQTVKSHLKTIFDKLGVRNRVELARRLAHQ